MEVNELSKTHFFIGTGGVGKTTLASLYALKLARLNPKSRVKLVTIDPPNRLKTFFGIDGGENSAAVNNLSVHLNDRTQLLKDFVTEAANKKNIDPQIIFSNKLFSALMEGLAVSQEFSSLYELCQSHQSEDFDFLIVDTPPLQNTSDFLSSSEVLSDFFSSSLAKFFLSKDEQGLLYKVVNSARRASLKVLANLTGSDFVDELSFFFKVIEFLREDLLSVLKSSKNILAHEAGVYIVCNANELSLCGVQVALENLSDTELNLKKCIVNQYDDKRIGKLTKVKMSALQLEFNNLDYVKVPQFETAPSTYEDLIERLSDVKL